MCVWNEEKIIFAVDPIRTDAEKLTNKFSLSRETADFTLWKPALEKSL